MSASSDRGSRASTPRVWAPRAAGVELVVGDERRAMQPIGGAVFALDVSHAADPANQEPLAGFGNFRDARMAAQVVSIKDAALIAQAKSMIDWHQRHGFCPRCGAPTAIMDAGYRRLCGKCNAEHFPRVDPVVIMLATHGEECLVGRGHQFPPGMMSALAGLL